MAQGQFTKEEAQESKDALTEIMKAMPKKKVIDFVGHFNDIFLFLEAAIKAAPSEQGTKEGSKEQWGLGGVKEE